MTTIRPATAADHDAVWAIAEPILQAGETYSLAPDMPRADFLAYWLGEDKYPYVAELGGQVVGTYLLKTNHNYMARHIANGSYMVAPEASGRGVGRAIGEHSLSEARRLGYSAMQFNFVVATNTNAIKLWQSLGFTIIGTVPDAFNVKDSGRFVDAHIMFRKL